MRKEYRKESGFPDRKIMKKKAYVIAGMAAMLALAGCNEQTVDNAKLYGEGVDSAFETEDMQLETCVMAVGEEEVSLNEFLFYVYQLKSSNDGVLTDDVWDYSYADGKNIEAYSKEEIVREIAQIKIICQEAEKEQVTLTEEETNQANVQAGKFVENLPEGVEDYNLTREMVSAIYQEHALAKKMYDVVGGTIDTTVTDDAASDPETGTAYKESVLAEREKEAFIAAYAEWKEEYKIVASQTLLDEISF